MTKLNQLNRAGSIAAPGVPEAKRLGQYLKELHTRLLYRCCDNPGLAIGTSSPAEVKIANAISVVVNGLFVSVAAQEVGFTATTHDLADGETCRYLLSVDSAGSVTITKGTAVTSGTPDTPETPDGETAIGYVQLAASGAIFNATTDNLSAAHITDTYVDLAENSADYLAAL